MGAAITRAIETLDDEICVVRTGVAALAAMADPECRLALIDLGLPDLAGAKVAEHARDGGLLVPCVAISGDLGLMDDLLRAGFVDGIGKPWLSSELVAIVEKYALPKP